MFQNLLADFVVCSDLSVGKLKSESRKLDKSFDVSLHVAVCTTGSSSIPKTKKT